MSFRLPSGETDHVYQVKLRDGRIVYRTKEELQELPPGAVVVGAAARKAGSPT
jgi:hypothetical protein